MLPNRFMLMGNTSRIMSLQSPSEGLRTDGAVGEALVRPFNLYLCSLDKELAEWPSTESGGERS